MTEKPANPHAFASPETEFTYGQQGLTALDYFAGQALAGMLASYHIADHSKDGDGETMVERIADRAYQYGAAMLAERAKRGLT